MNGDISGFPSALDTSEALRTNPRPQFSWDGVYRFTLGHSTLELPDDDQLKNALLGIYLGSGLDGVAVAWESARAGLDGFATPGHDEELISELKTAPGAAAEYEKKFAEFQLDFLEKNPRLASGRTLVQARARNAAFRKRLVETIDDILSAEEEAQRWYEKKLLELIELHLTRQKALIEEAWTKTYQIGLADKTPPEGVVRIDGDVSSAKLKIRDTKDMVDVDRFSRAEHIQDATKTTAKVPAVIAALHEVGSRYYAYKNELEGRIKANKIRQRTGAATLAIDDLPSYKPFTKALHEHGAKHFVLWATFRHVIVKSIDTTFTQEMQDRCERLIIDALRAAWKNCDVVISNAKADRLFKDEKPKCVTGRDEMGIAASAQVVAAIYEPDDSQKGLSYRGAPQTETQEAPEISRSLWLQAPFHGLLIAFAANEAASQSVADVSVEHLRPLFGNADDQKRLFALKAMGSFVSRARSEMVSALTRKAALKEKGRRNISLAVAGLGLVGAPFTGGTSLVVAGIVDAALVAEKTSSEIAKWIAAEQYSRLVVDEMTAQAWEEPAVSELMGIVFEAGFQIAGDLAQEGAVAHFFAAVGLTEILAAGAGLAYGALTKHGATP